eukprot:TRINITY_DN18389_c0_g1_i1.p1 TRINITY_DN18389_c0_g1~~TRINITY_DN18389_c0_g1_i1.p1  ORF type:complete len:127 (+),score=14.42 TRINITY_DN18389_c0_g1_i1:127-507(+)
MPFQYNIHVYNNTPYHTIQMNRRLADSLSVAYIHKPCTKKTHCQCHNQSLAASFARIPLAGELLLMAYCRGFKRQARRTEARRGQQQQQQQKQQQQAKAKKITAKKNSHARDSTSNTTDFFNLAAK